MIMGCKMEIGYIIGLSLFLIAVAVALLIYGIRIKTDNVLLRNISNKKFFNESDWQIVWQDNFETLDRTMWKFNAHKNGKRNAGYYVDDEKHIFTQGGYLYIRTTWEENGKYGAGFYTGWLETAKTRYTDNYDYPEPDNWLGFNQKFGYFEIRCKCPAAEGIWSAFWLLPENTKALSEDDELGTGKDGVEIDIMESAFYREKLSKVQHVIHADYNATHAPVSAHSQGYLLDDMYHEFHTYALEWNEKEYIFYVDGIETWRTDHYNGTSLVEQYLILSVEVGNDNVPWAGDPNHNDKSKCYDFVIDYIKVMKKRDCIDE